MTTGDSGSPPRSSLRSACWQSGLYLASGLVAPIWAILVLWLIWLGLAWYGLRLARAGSYRVLAVPVLAAAIWYLVLAVGEQALGWQA